MPHLLDPADSILIAIDIQDAFLDKLPATESKLLLNRACWLISVAHWLNIPLIVTAEELPSQPLAPQLQQALPANTPVYNKLSFGLAHQPDILGAVIQTTRSTAVLIGLETDVCVAQSAIGLMEQGVQVAVVADATGTPEAGQQIGLNRMQQAGAILVSTKSLFYEWMRTIDRINRFHAENPTMRSVEGISL